MTRSDAYVMLGGLIMLAIVLAAIKFIIPTIVPPPIPTAAEYVMCHRAMGIATNATDSLALKRLHVPDGHSCGDVLEYGHKGAWPRDGEPFTSTAP